MCLEFQQAGDPVGGCSGDRRSPSQKTHLMADQRPWALAQVHHLHQSLCCSPGAQGLWVLAWLPDSAS